MERRRVLPDVNVCFPISLLDLVLRLDEADLHQVIWTEDLLDELTRVWVEHGARSAEAAAKVCGDIRKAFVGQDVPRREYEDLVASMPGSDPDDHAHAAAAVARTPCIILTKNTKDFPSKTLTVHGVMVREPDDYLAEIFDQHPDEMVDIVRQMAADRSKPPMTATEVVDALARAGVPELAARVRRRLSQ